MNKNQIKFHAITLSTCPEVRRADTLFGRSPMEKDVAVSKVVPFDDGREMINHSLSLSP